ncbi:MAG: Omp28-related outer membrane protein, partial [Ignavibacteria bacterium]|nr:Omp28-related outer membrane protein [Ignavibacteria bacterium]
MKKLIFTLLLLFSSYNVFAFERFVLAEIFTSTTCPPCAQQNPIFDSWYFNYAQKNRVTVIKYHTWWPSPGNDPFYLSNVSENRGRVLYYWPSLNTYVPRCQVNGLIDAGEYASDWSNQIINHLSVSTPIEMKITLESGNVKIRVTADNTTLPSGTYVLHLAVVESYLAYTGTNGDPMHHYVMRKMFPDHNGETFSITSNQTVNFTKSIQWNPNWKIQNCEVVAFVQIWETKEVLQSAKAKFNLLQSPNLIYPENNAKQIPSSVTFKWNRIANMKLLSSVTKYQLQVADDSNFSSVVFSFSDLIDTNKTVSGLLGDKKYYWRVKAYSDSGISNWSSVWNFSTILS